MTREQALELFRDMKLGPCRERYGDIGCYHIPMYGRIWFVWIDLQEGRLIDVT